jgi:uncharacterized membrane protein YraQ (UPF0718 family)
MKFIIVFALSALLISIFADRKKTFAGVKKGLKMFVGILPSLFNVLILVSLFLVLVPESVLIKWLGEGSGLTGFIVAAILGSIAMIPGFIAFPLGAILLKSGVTYKVVSVFVTTLMMVGIITIPLEAKYFGLKVTILRNALSFVGALITGLVMGLFL